MRRSFLFAVTALLVLSLTAIAGPDLSKIERKLVKEPVYRNKPKYCLLVFGPEAKTRVWLVQDGDTLYVDRLANGDLTSPGDKVSAEKQPDAEEGYYAFNIGNLRAGNRLHKELMVRVARLNRLADLDETIRSFVRKHAHAAAYSVLAAIEMRGRKGTEIGGRVLQRCSLFDANGVFQFADRPADAPIVHFDGPWQVALFGPQKLTIGRDTDVVLGVGSPGVGPGSTTWIDYEGVIPADKYPTVEILYAPKSPGDAPVREHYELR